MGQLPTDRTISNTPAEHVADHNELHRLHDVVDGVSLLEATDGDPVPLAVLESKIGIDMDGNPYFDADGAVSGEEAALLIDPYTGALLVSKPNPAAGSHDVDSGAHPSILARLAALESGASSTGIVWVDSDGTIDEVATAAHVATFSIIAADTVAQTLKVAGNRLLDFPNNITLVVTGSTGNNGSYTCNGCSFDGTDTLVAIVEPVPDATGDGTITTTTGRYDWSVVLPAGAWLLGVYAFPIAAAWAADVAILSAADAIGTYISGSSSDLTAAAGFDPYSLTPGDGYAGYTNLSWEVDTGSLSADLNWTTSRAQVGLPVGREFPAGGTVTMRVTTELASPPVVPTGSLKFRLAYLLPTLTAPAAPVVA